jgi:hypothetical protein
MSYKTDIKLAVCLPTEELMEKLGKERLSELLASKAPYINPICPPFPPLSRVSSTLRGFVDLEEEYDEDEDEDPEIYSFIGIEIDINLVYFEIGDAVQLDEFWLLPRIKEARERFKELTGLEGTLNLICTDISK